MNFSKLPMCPAGRTTTFPSCKGEADHERMTPDIGQLGEAIDRAEEIVRQNLILQAEPMNSASCRTVRSRPLVGSTSI
jgi:hypothetical protein